MGYTALKARKEDCRRLEQQSVYTEPESVIDDIHSVGRAPLPAGHLPLKGAVAYEQNMLRLLWNNEVSNALPLLSVGEKVVRRTG